jgi:hypothetical protein
VAIARNQQPPICKNQIRAESSLGAAFFSTLSCAIRFIVTVEIASVFRRNQRERKVAKKQKIHEMARYGQPEN